MSIIIKPPAPLDVQGFSVFLAGSIEGGKAFNWQEVLEKLLKDQPIVILNPRRDAWDASWEQKITNPMFKGQVDWELDGQEKADVIAMVFDSTTKSPITLLELGLFAKTGKLVVFCPDGFWRKGNVDIVCERYGIKQVNTIEALVNEIISGYKSNANMLNV